MLDAEEMTAGGVRNGSPPLDGEQSGLAGGEVLLDTDVPSDDRLLVAMGGRAVAR
jgi:hypothetical protein